jgi:hypothetical protein
MMCRMNVGPISRVIASGKRSRITVGKPHPNSQPFCKHWFTQLVICTSAAFVTSNPEFWFDPSYLSLVHTTCETTLDMIPDTFCWLWVLTTQVRLHQTLMSASCSMQGKLY